MPHNRSDFIGAWSLVDWRIEYSDGNVTRPFGEGAHGYIVYSQDGTMTASIAKNTRPAFGLTNARNASVQQKSAAFDSYFHYAGPWKIDGEEVVHTVTMSLNPDMTGTQQRRVARFSGNDELTLSALEATKSGGERHHILQWRKIPSLSSQ
ncbi:lipocalin-like domain-containing protein [Parasphingorhabdus sp.]|uniref:lipocalin-like domain-containing protein n=1 Tax=Parasphingorhabdus sp. TaxID=2709688 RepID=UPI002F9363C4